MTSHNPQTPGDKGSASDSLKVIQPVSARTQPGFRTLSLKPALSTLTGNFSAPLSLHHPCLWSNKELPESNFVPVNLHSLSTRSETTGRKGAVPSVTRWVSCELLHINPGKEVFISAKANLLCESLHYKHRLRYLGAFTPSSQRTASYRGYKYSLKKKKNHTVWRKNQNNFR